MKYLIFSATLLLGLWSCDGGNNHFSHGNELKSSDFKSEKLSKTATIVLNSNIDNVFPLFNPVEEQKWAPAFKPQFIYPLDMKVQEGMSFRTSGHGDESEFLWIISKFNEERHLIQYLVSTANRYWTITVKCKSSDDDRNQTLADISYEYFALNQKGIKLNRMQIDKIYVQNLKDWEEAINDYLETNNSISK